MRLALPVALLVVLPVFEQVSGQTSQASFDILITNARVMDGSGNPWMRADVGIRGDRIAAIGRLASASAPIVIDAKDRLVTPGFIDVHSHASGGLTNPTLRDARQLLAQGVTLAVLNPDGGGPTDLKQQGLELEKDGIGINAALVIGHASVRNAAMRRPAGPTDPDAPTASADRSARRDPTPDELNAMRALVKQAVADGAYGLSSGLFYTPGRFSRTEEVIALAREAGGVYTSHIRDEGTYDVGVVASVDEVIRIAEEAKVRGVVSHMKCLGPDSWGLSKTLIEHIEAARARGLEIFADQYPYEASSTGLSAAVMPGEGGESAKEAMSGAESRKQFLALVKENIRRRGGPRSIVIASGRGAPQMAGKNLEEIAKARGVEPEQAAVDIVLGGGASIVSFNMSEDDIERIMRQPWTMGSSDGGLVSPGAGQPHPRNNGAFPRRIARYVRERQAITLEHAVRTMTSLPAHVFGFTGRGEIREGAYADLVIFDPAKVVDRATYQSPHQMAEGIDWAIVNGKVARREGEFTGIRAGRVLRKTDR
jgi:N-acyl-D-aspartate/D-glutamate deacylase